MPAGLDGNPDPIITNARAAVIASVVDQVQAQRDPTRPYLVAVDGIDGSGKSTFADEMAAELGRRSVPVVRSTIDSFHNPRSVRWKRGKDSPVGFYLDSHDLDAVQELLLEPFKQGQGDYVSAAFDEPTDEAVDIEPKPLRGDEVLVFDGIFAQRRELAPYWDLTLWLDGQRRVDLRRLGLVMQDLPDDPGAIVAHTLEWQRRIERYSSGMRYYLDLVDPISKADIVIDNNDLSSPTVMGSSSDQ